jgi:hypothetical protein
MLFQRQIAPCDSIIYAARSTELFIGSNPHLRNSISLANAMQCLIMQIVGDCQQLFEIMMPSRQRRETMKTPDLQTLRLAFFMNNRGHQREREAEQREAERQASATRGEIGKFELERSLTITNAVSIEKVLGIRRSTEKAENSSQSRRARRSSRLRSAEGCWSTGRLRNGGSS